MEEVYMTEFSSEFIGEESFMINEGYSEKGFQGPPPSFFTVNYEYGY